ncbi:MAG: gamma-glutamyltransferase [Cyanothece sp. SIO2G6]|nr:gamma-glutamyltransferase [Cyanothece sp. SIO2G6]
MARFMVAIAVVGGVVLGALQGGSQTVVETPVVSGYGGAVASEDIKATQIGIDILAAGGNAIDAAVATAAALGVTDPFSAGIGGGGFMVIYLKNTNASPGQEPYRVITLDGREEAPAAVTPDLFQDPANPTGAALPFFPNRVSSGLAIGVPGTPLNWETALHRYGTLSLAEVLAPAIALAENGFIVDETFAQQVQINLPRFAAFTSTRNLYLPGGLPPQVGSVLRNPDLASTYRVLAEQGSNGFYRGKIAEAIVNTVQSPPTVRAPDFTVYPGKMTLADLDAYEVRVRRPVATNYRGYRFYGMGLPSSGGITVAQALAFMENRELAENTDLAALSQPEVIHRVLEVSRLAFSDRNAFLGDPEYVDVPLVGLLNPNYVQQRAALIGDRATHSKAAPGNPLPYQNDPSPSLTTPTVVAKTNTQEGQSTTHLTVADQFGNVVSYTLTIEMTGGSGIVVPGYGFLLNNELTDFDVTRPHPNIPEPGKRPRSSMAPTIAIAPDDSILAFGSPGGSTIISTVLGIATNLIDLDMNLEEAIAAPRLSQRNTETTSIEASLDGSELFQSLVAKGHELTTTAEIGAATGIQIALNGRMTAVAEPNRRGGGAAMVVNPAS